jgi:hypothetical protein
MAKVAADISVSLDGFLAGPNDGPDNPLGDGGDRLHQWLYGLASWREPHGLAGGETGADAEVLDEALAKRDTTFTFVTDGIESAVEQARAAAGDKDVSVAGGAATIQQCIEAGLLDQIQIHVVPVLLGGGIRLFDELGAGPIELERTRVIASTDVAHLRFRVK